MRREALAKQFRDHQVNYCLADREEIDSLSDEEIIDHYITCDCCGESVVTPDELDLAIKMADNANDFLQVCDEFNRQREIRDS